MTISHGEMVQMQVAGENRCICCGEIIPEGRQVCPVCEKMTGPTAEEILRDFKRYLECRVEAAWSDLERREQQDGPDAFRTMLSRQVWSDMHCCLRMLNDHGFLSDILNIWEDKKDD